MSNAPTPSTTASDPRQARGLALAKTKGTRIRHIVAGKYLVPSAQDTKSAGYVVDLDNGGACTCPDHAERRAPCKHYWAVTYIRQEVTTPDGSTVVSEALIVTKKPTYPQRWGAYNRARAEEPVRMPYLLHDLCKMVDEPAREPGKAGRPRLPLRDGILCAAMKVYLKKTQRDLEPYLAEAVRAGLITRVPSLGSLSHTMEDETLTPVLERLVEVSGTPLRGVETSFAIDGTGFGTKQYVRWLDSDHGTRGEYHDWIRLNACVATRSNVYTAVRVTKSDGPGSGEQPHVPYLIARTVANGWNLQEVSADKGYSGAEVLAAIERAGATPFVKFKDNARMRGIPVWDESFHMFCAERALFDRHYHQRSNVEATFGATKERFDVTVSSKLLASQFNEVLLKCLCFNLARLVLFIHEFGIAARFPMPSAPAMLPEGSAA